MPSPASPRRPVPCRAHPARAGTGGDRQSCRTARGEIGLSRGKLMPRLRLDQSYAQDSTMLRVLVGEDVHLPESPARRRRDKRPFPK